MKFRRVVDRRLALLFGKRRNERYAHIKWPWEMIWIDHAAEIIAQIKDACLPIMNCRGTRSSPESSGNADRSPLWTTIALASIL